MPQINDEFEFAEEKKEVLATPLPAWKILTVDDDLDYQQSLVNGIQQLKNALDHPLHILCANSAFEAAEVLSQHPDIALIFLDVVMEDDAAGLRLVKTIREVFANASIRIVLLTGQPGFAPEAEIMQSLEIDEYWQKSELVITKLHSVITSNLRSWHNIEQLTQAQKGLQMVVDAARSISNKREITSFIQTVLQEIGNIVGVHNGGIMCLSLNNTTSANTLNVVTAIGCYKKYTDLPLALNKQDEYYQNIHDAISSKHSVVDTNLSVFYFQTTDIDNNIYLMLVKSDHPISEANKNLLKVFSENIHGGFTNIALMNKLTEMAYSDQELNLPNRNWLLRECANMSRNERLQSKILLLHVKQIKEISFAFGEKYATKVLNVLQQNIRQALPNNTPIATIDRQQFVLLLHNDFLVDIALQQQLIHQQFSINKVKHNIDLMIVEMPLADCLDYSATKILNILKSSVKSAHHKQISYYLHSKQDSVDTTRRYDLMHELRNAIRDKKLSVMLQPKVRLSDEDVVGFESLARWQRDDGSYVGPDEFIKLAETAGIIYELDCLIFEKTLVALKQLIAHGINLPVAINASTIDIKHPHYFEFISSNLRKNNLSPDLLELEITETQAINDYADIKSRLRKFSQLGIKVSLDDFGTGHSSLAHINNINADYLKIDRSFVNGLTGELKMLYIVQMILELGHKFAFHIIAEGIETKEQLQILKDLGCDLGQGYLFAKPMPVAELISWCNR